MRILIVDDDVWDLDDRQAQLKPLSEYFDLEVVEAQSAEQGWHLFDESWTTHPYDIVLADCFMGHRTGLWLSQMIAERQRGARKTYVAMITDSGDDQLRDLAKAAAVDIFFKKDELRANPDALHDFIFNSASLLKSPNRPALTGIKNPDRIVRVLIVDDDKDAIVARRALLRELTNRYKIAIEFQSARNGEEALTLFEEAQKNSHAIDLILTDYYMEPGDGLHLANVVNPLGISEAKRTPIFMITNASEDVYAALQEHTAIDEIYRKHAPFAEDFFRAVAGRLHLEQRTIHPHWLEAWAIPPDNVIQVAKDILEKLVPRQMPHESELNAGMLFPHLELPDNMSRASVLRALYYLEPHIAAALLVSFGTRHGFWASIIEPLPGLPQIEPDLLAAIVSRGMAFFMHQETGGTVRLKYQKRVMPLTFDLDGLTGMLGYLSPSIVLQICLGLSDQILGRLVKEIIEFILLAKGGRDETFKQLLALLEALASNRLADTARWLSPEHRQYLNAIEVLPKPVPPPAKWVSQAVPRVYGRAVGRLVVLEGKDLSRERLAKVPREAIVAMEYLPDSDASIGPFRGILTYREEGKGSHAEARARRWGIPHALWPGPDSTLQELDGNLAYFEVSEEGITVREATEVELLAYEQNRTSHVWDRVIPAEADLTGDKFFIEKGDPEMTRSESVGPKAAMLAQLAQHSFRLSDPKIRVRFATGASLPYRSFVHLMQASGNWKRYQFLVKKLNEGQRVDENLAELRKIVEDPSFFSPEFRSQWLSSPGLKRSIHNGVFLRGSVNTENLRTFPGFGAGMYATVPNVRGEQAFNRGLSDVTASVWSPEAYWERNRFKVPEDKVFPSIWYVDSVPGEYSAIIHTSDVSTNHFGHLTIEVTQHLGEGLVSSDELFAGFPSRMRVNKSDGRIILRRASTKSYQSVLAEGGGTMVIPIDPSKEFIRNPSANRLVKALMEFGIQVEEISENGPQEIEVTMEEDHSGEWTITGLQTRDLLPHGTPPAPVRNNHLSKPDPFSHAA